MNLECPGCRSSLKLDPAKLPAGATTAICPKCRARISIPGAGSTGAHLSVQCGHCGARLRVNASRLKPGVTRSKCPKCGGAVELPSGPAAEKPAAMPVSAQTRRLDAREMGMLLGGARPSAGSEATATPVPIAVEAPSDSSDFDLAHLVDQKAERLGTETGPRPHVSTAPAPEPPVPLSPAVKPSVGEAAPPSPSPAPPALAPPAEGGPWPGASLSGVGKKVERSSPDALVRGPSDSRSRAAPRSDRAPGTTPPPAPRRGAAPGFISLAGLIAGSIVGGGMALLAGFLPASLFVPVPATVTPIIGESVARVILIALFSALSALLGGASRPARAEGGPSVIRFAIASGCVGLLAGAAFTIASGAFDLRGTLAWLLSLTVAGALTSPIAAALAPPR